MLASGLINRTKHPLVLIPDSNGIIHHPTYGDYLAKVKFDQGMTIFPGQTADVGGYLNKNDIKIFQKRNRINLDEKTNNK